jgi:hypothetical protein
MEQKYGIAPCHCWNKMEVSGKLLSPATSPSRKELYLERLGGPQCRYEGFREKKTQIPDRPSLSLLLILKTWSLLFRTYSIALHGKVICQRNMKSVEGRKSRLNRRHHSAICWEDWGKEREASNRIIGIPAVFRIGHLPTTIRKHDRLI